MRRTLHSLIILLPTREMERGLYLSKKYREKLYSFDILGIRKIRDGKCLGYVI